MASRTPDLDPAQRRAVEHERGPLLVLAGPGSGKTRVVTHRIARLIACGVEARQILAVTFTNKAAKEMRERVRALVGKGGRELTVATFHSACARILRQEIEALGYRRNFSIYDESSQESLVRVVLRDFRAEGASLSPSMLVAAIAAAKNPAATASPPPEEGEEGAKGGDDDVAEDIAGDVVAAVAPPPVDLDAQAREALIAAAHERYQAELQARNAVDFDDLILLTLRLFREHPPALARWRARYRHVLVDEYQDTNRTQDELLALLTGEHRNLCVVGDDDQSIYGWRGAEVEHILTFPRRYPDAVVVRLERNYRSTRHIVSTAVRIISANPRRHAKELYSRRPPGDAVRLLELRDAEEEADTIAREIGRALEGAADRFAAAADHAVLFRTNEQIRPLEQALRRLQVPYRLLGGRSFFDRKEALDILAYLRLAANRDDEEALFRILNVPARGLGARAVQAIRASAAAAGSGAWAAIASFAAGTAAGDALPERAAETLKGFVAVIERVERDAARRARTLVTDLLESIGYKREVERSYKDERVQATRWLTALELQKTWESHLDATDSGGLTELLDSLALRGRHDDDGRGSGATLATVHASKGLEFPSVYVAGLEEGIFPHRRSVTDARSLAEERRLLYVAVTRARDRLTLTRCQSRGVRGREMKTERSRFLTELPAEVEARDLTAPPPPAAVADHVARMRALLGR